MIKCLRPHDWHDIFLSAVWSSSSRYFLWNSTVIKCVLHKVRLWVNVQTNEAMSVFCELMWMFPVCSSARTDRRKDVKTLQSLLELWASVRGVESRFCEKETHYSSVCLSAGRQTDHMWKTPLSCSSSGFVDPVQERKRHRPPSLSAGKWQPV